MRKVVYFDGHNDTLTTTFPRAKGTSPTSQLGTDATHVNYQRAMQANYLGALFAIFVEPPQDEDDEENDLKTGSGRTLLAPPINPQFAQQQTEAILSQVLQAERLPNCPWRIARTYEDLRNNINANKMSLVLHLEGAEAIDEDLHRLEIFHAAGLRSLGIVWSRPNIFGQGVPFERPGDPNTGYGLTPAGKRLVRRCNELGILVDLAHLNERGFWDVARISSAPLVVSHSASYAMAPSARNLTDEQLYAIKKSNGIVGLTLHVADLRPDGQYKQELGLSYFMEHLMHIKERIGIDHIGLGSDFDGACMPSELQEVSQLPNLTEELEEAGLSTEDIDKFTHQNWMRIICDTWK